MVNPHAGVIYLADGLEERERVHFSKNMEVHNLLYWGDLVESIGFHREEDPLIYVEVSVDEVNHRMTYTIKGGSEHTLVESMTSLALAIDRAFFHHQFNLGLPIPSTYEEPNFTGECSIVYISPENGLYGIDENQEFVESLQNPPTPHE